jgi:hypothetical protein
LPSIGLTYSDLEVYERVKRASLLSLSITKHGKKFYNLERAPLVLNLCLKRKRETR